MRLGTWIMAALILISAVPAVGIPLELISNGDFEGELNLGWRQSVIGDGGLVERRIDLDHDEDYELWMQLLSDDGITWLFQRFEIPGTDLDFSAQVRAYSFGNGGAWVASGLLLRYLDREMQVLGSSARVCTSLDCPWVDSPSFNLVELDSNVWESVEFNLNDELLELPGVDPDLIVYLEVALMYEAENC